MASFLILTVYALALLAIPSVSATTKSFPVVATFEGLQANLLGLTTVIPPPNPYQNLSYQNVIVAKNGPVAVASLQTPSGSQYAATNPAQFPFITSVYPNSKVASFDMASLLTGCYLSAANGDAAPPVDCTLRFTGTTVGGMIVTEDFTFLTGFPTGLAVGKVFLKQVTFESKFKGLKSLDIRPVVSTLTPAVAGVDIDLVSYTIHTI